MDKNLVLKKMEEKLNNGQMVPLSFMIKSEEDIKGIYEASLINIKILDYIESLIKVGIKTNEIDALVRVEYLRVNAKSAILNYDSFPGAICISVNDCVAHGVPSNYIIKLGDVVKVDATSIYKGYYSDSTRTIIVGENKEASKALECLNNSIKKAISKIVPFESHLGDIGYYIYNDAKDNGYDVVLELLGHGVGNEFHEEPFICHKGKFGTDFLIVPNMVFTIEPIFTLGKAKIKLGKDLQSYYTKDKSLSVQTEYTVLIKENNAEIIGY